MSHDKKARQRANEWLAKAHDDELNAQSLLKHRDGAPSGVCFLAHQMAEKHLKAYLVFTTNYFPKIHPLDTLLELCINVDPQFNQLKDDVIFLNPLYTPARYPGDYPDFSWQDAELSFASAQRIQQFIVKCINN